jgi:hypothetical protein
VPIRLPARLSPNVAHDVDSFDKWETEAGERREKLTATGKQAKKATVLLRRRSAP